MTKIINATLYGIHHMSPDETLAFIKEINSLRAENERLKEDIKLIEIESFAYRKSVIALKEQNKKLQEELDAWRDEGMI